MNDSDENGGGAPETGFLETGPYLINLDTGELMRDGEPVHLPPMASKALALLAARKDKLVSRRELEERLWGANADISETALNAIIRQLRAAFGEDGAGKRYITTMPRRGYRLTTPRNLGSDRTKPAAAAPGRNGAGARRLMLAGASGAAASAALLAAANFLLAPQRFAANSFRAPAIAVERAVEGGLYQDYPSFARGLTDEIITRLMTADIGDAAIIDRRATADARADYYISSVYASYNDLLRITVTFSSRDGSRVEWSGSYEGDIDAAYDVIAAAADAVAQEIENRVNSSAASGGEQL